MMSGTGATFFHRADLRMSVTQTSRSSSAATSAAASAVEGTTTSGSSLAAATAATTFRRWSAFWKIPY
jgi:hypothetical protein